jgi:superfamily II DNA or RNA helicase
MAGLREYNWEVRYESSRHDLVKDFYVPALEHSKRYCRIAGYFSSSSIAAAAAGITHFVDGGEKMFMIIGNSITEDDVEALNRGVTDRELLEKKWSECLAEIENDIRVKDRFEALAWLLANNKLEIKIGVNLENGEIISSTGSKFHEKVTIFEDEFGDSIQTDGSQNETFSAYELNRESFCVHRSWINGQTEFIENARSTFWDLWNNMDPMSRTYDISTAMREGLISFASTEAPRLECGGKGEHSGKEKMELRRYQMDAIEAWNRAGNKGVLEMATGTGKTITALSAVEKFCSVGKILLIVVPQKELASQWADECNNIFGNCVDILECHSYNKKWKEKIRPFLTQSRWGFKVVITIVNTFRTDFFQEVIARRLSCMLLVCDEVHELGAELSRTVFQKISGIDIRLGLSATPERQWDSQGNTSIKEYFNGDPVFVYGLDKAINPEPGYEKCLCDYDYHFRTCHLSSDELESYINLTEQIEKKCHFIDIEDMFQNNDNKELQRLLNNRARVVKGCRNRVDRLFRIITEEGDNLNSCIIYCNTINEIDAIAARLVRIGKTAVGYHSHLDPEERNTALKAFRDGTARFIVAVGCLDQGVDIPSCDGAVIMSSSKNPREYVQRRGRVLRLYKNKKKATIFDMLVLPYPEEDLENGRVWLDSHELNLINSQFKRVEEFAASATNKSDFELEYARIKRMVRGANG